MIRVNTIIENSDWNKKIQNPKSYLKLKIKNLSKIKHFKKHNQEFSILLTDKKKNEKTK